MKKSLSTYPQLCAQCPNCLAVKIDTQVIKPHFRFRWQHSIAVFESMPKEHCPPCKQSIS